MRVQIEIPVTIVSEMNRRDGWRARKRRFDAQVMALHYAWTSERTRNPVTLAQLVTLPVSVLLTRIAPQRMDDDNLRSGWKGLRDYIASRLERDDADPSIRWDYDQEKGRGYAARVVIERGDGGTER